MCIRLAEQSHTIISGKANVHLIWSYQECRDRQGSAISAQRVPPPHPLHRHYICTQLTGLVRCKLVTRRDYPFKQSIKDKLLQFMVNNLASEMYRCHSFCHTGTPQLTVNVVLFSHIYTVIYREKWPF